MANKRLSEQQWRTVFTNLSEMGEEVEVLWLEGTTPDSEEWVLCCDIELFEDGFKTEQDTMKRLKEMEEKYHG